MNVPPKKTNRRSGRLRLAVLLGIFVFSMAVYGSSFLTTGSWAGHVAVAEPATASQVVLEPRAEPAGAQDYSRFRHDTQQHTRMPCLVCHVRNDNRAAMRFPGHIPCASCHQEQWTDNKQPICYICHTSTDVKPFPTLKSFRTKFDHGRHTKLANCATCHKPASRGAALSVPSRLNGHVTCFQCHGPDAKSGDKDIGSCVTCHEQGRPGRFSAASRAYGVNFSHSEHARKGLSCAECHQVRAGMPRGRQVSSPLVSMHFAPARTKSCGACHNNQRAFGGTDFSDCKRCHEGSSFKF